MPENRPKVTKEVLCEEARFILAHVMAEARYGRQNRYEDVRRICEGAVSIPFSEYVSFLESAGYLHHEPGSDALQVTAEGEGVVNGGRLAELTERAVMHFKSARRRKDDPRTGIEMIGPSGGPPPPPIPAGPAERAQSDRHRVTSSQGRSSILVGGEIQPGREHLLDNRYEKLETLGTGGIGTVYRVRQVPLQREVALKEIHDIFGFFSEDQRHEIIRRFADVVRAAAQLAHPNILPIHEANLDREYPYVVTELAPNGSCRRLLTDAEEIPASLALRYLVQTLHALHAAHELDVYHRGLKPENLLIDAYGNLKVSDFGFARIVERDAAVIRQVYVGMGNIAYMAPELYTDPTGAGAQTDIYALGIIFYELLARKLPGRRSPMPSELDAQLPKGLDDIFDRMTRDARAERYSSIDDILSDLEALSGLDDLLGPKTQVLAADNPLDSIRFRDPESADPAQDPAQNPAQTKDSAEAIPEPASSSSRASSDKLKSPPPRSYSYQQRRTGPLKP